MGKWYILHVRTGQEEKIRKLLENQLNKKEKQITQIVIPKEEIVERGKEEKKTTRRFWPGYMLIEIAPEFDNEILWHRIRTTTGVLNFLGAGDKPVPLQPEEAKNVIGEVEKRKSKPTPKVEFKEGDKVEITEGPFMNFTAIVEEVYPDKGRLKVSVSAFGRSTPLELSFWQVEKI
ncbi:MAG TPA: transcription termination/antitermination protein NusG [Candidatus Ratteibacteria bacterium]|nr:transcription termination/antitermination protein NusG [bacterium]HRR95923.1 transcription termination/antitermination protein NusG [Candidatus Ratteibacteria bacterium]